ncbi:mitochondrial N-terminal GAL4-like Zn2Cys6 binuclear cluster DNA-binding domain-containing protein [Andalucia godoyi]|uniref:Mitochondrial N-terminal GAL4-like Zn2Cys6 binuclear cluster DNA-binding domain-containing protein n=1 Tax=Andalucia godoyi TaxID=505711 RepID=A0A8K0AIW9_ANDGO|nr:mitochondrial N-terminal GAL4-like Zn2Cys6 binuclear cluster DNA-binding domain-containing protein [Andalucia godoyi]|eukprot:ANDGO_00718.mRNA.1 mitochondrial N-terminal GAL4-like Zn2Cys6 binuclear cluster DNA-binding domain-containing protein
MSTPFFHSTASSLASSNTSIVTHSHGIRSSVQSAANKKNRILSSNPNKRACDSCRAAHAACSGVFPCSRCIDQDLTCVLPAPACRKRVWQTLSASDFEASHHLAYYYRSLPDGESVRRLEHSGAPSACKKDLDCDPSAIAMYEEDGPSGKRKIELLPHIQEFLRYQTYRSAPMCIISHTLSNKDLHPPVTPFLAEEDRVHCMQLFKAFRQLLATYQSVKQSLRSIDPQLHGIANPLDVPSINKSILDILTASQGMQAVVDCAGPNSVVKVNNAHDTVVWSTDALFRWTEVPRDAIIDKTLAIVRFFPEQHLDVILRTWWRAQMNPRVIAYRTVDPLYQGRIFLTQSLFLRNEVGKVDFSVLVSRPLILWPATVAYAKEMFEGDLSLMDIMPNTLGNPSGTTSRSHFRNP